MLLIRTSRTNLSEILSEIHIFSLKNAFGNVCEMASILSRFQCVNDKSPLLIQSLASYRTSDYLNQWWSSSLVHIQYIPRNMHTVTALLCFVVVIRWLLFPYPSGLLHWHCGNLTIAPVPAKQPWWIWINTLCKFIMNHCITTIKQSTTKPCAYFLGYTVCVTEIQSVQIHVYMSD